MSDDIVWQAEVAGGAGPIFRIGRRGDEVIAEWPQLARLTATRDGAKAELVFDDAVLPQDRMKIERGSARVLVQSLRGGFALHAGAIANGTDAVLVVGRTRHGKSTLVASACASGAALLADDVVELERLSTGWHARAEERHCWLEPGSAQAVGLDVAPVPVGQKQPFAIERVATGPRRIAAIIDLRFGGTAPQVLRIDAIDAAGAIIPQVVRFVLDDDDLRRAELETVIALVREVPIFVLERPRDLAQLPRTVELLRAILDGQT